MANGVWVVLIVALYVVLMRYVLPRFGVQT